MAVDVMRYRDGEGERWGVVSGDRVVPIPGDHPTTRSLMLDAAPALVRGDLPAGPSTPIGEVELACPITPDRQFLCQAINYHSHLRESGLSPASSPYNIFFRKASSCLAPADTDIVTPDGVEFLDYEIEIGLVLSSNVSAPVEVTDANLGDHVGGLVALDDVSARDVQIPEGQFYKGKSHRTFGPAGPWITLVTAEELARFDRLRLRLSVNGEVRQDSLADDMVHRPPAALTELSAFQDWEAGDVLATGTPGGCALQAPPKPIAMLAQAVSPARRHALLRRAAARNTKRLRPGDRIEASIRTDDGSIDLGEHHNVVR